VKVKVYGRLSFPDIWRARMQGEEGEPKFAANFIIDPKHPCVAVVEAAIKSAATDKWGAKATSMLAKLETEGRVCLHKSPRTNSSGEVYDGYEDHYWLGANSKVKPKTRDADGKTDLTEADGKLYSGCQAVGVIDIFAHFHPKGGNRVLSQLKGVQFAGHGEAFGGGAPASDDDFDEIEIPEDAAELV
jgi:hypothetical protein